MFIEGKESVVYCFSLEELKNIIESNIDNNIKKEVNDHGLNGSENKTIIFKLYNFETWVNITSLEALLNEKVNTIMLVPKIDYYEPVKSSRKVIFDKDDLSDQFSSEFKINQTEYYDEGKYRYRKRRVNFWDEGQTQDTGILESIEWLRYNRNTPGQTIRMNYDQDEPAYIVYDREGRKIEEEYVYDNIGCQVSFYENGNKKKELWHVDDVIHSDDYPAVIEYYENQNGGIKKKRESWYNEGVLIRTVFYYENDKIQKESWHDEDKKFHREGDLPAVVEYYENGNREKDYFYRHGVLIKSIIYYNNETNKKQAEKWLNEDKKLNREGDLPAVTFYYENGNKERESWYTNNVLIKSIFYSEDEKKEKEEWYDEYKNIHREGDLPAVTKYYENGNKEHEIWYKNGTYHRDNRDNQSDRDSENKETNLPAVIEYYENGLYKRKQWYRNGKLNRDNNLPQDVFYYNNGRLQREMWWSNNKNNIKKKIFYREDGHGYISENGTITNF